MGRMVGRAAGGGAGFVDQHQLFDPKASDFDTRQGGLGSSGCRRLQPGLFARERSRVH